MLILLTDFAKKGTEQAQIADAVKKLRRSAKFAPDQLATAGSLTRGTGRALYDLSIAQNMSGEFFQGKGSIHGKIATARKSARTINKAVNKHFTSRLQSGYAHGKMGLRMPGKNGKEDRIGKLGRHLQEENERRLQEYAKKRSEGLKKVGHQKTVAVAAHAVVAQLHVILIAHLLAHGIAQVSQLVVDGIELFKVLQER